MRSEGRQQKEGPTIHHSLNEATTIGQQAIELSSHCVT